MQPLATNPQLRLISETDISHINTLLQHASIREEARQNDTQEARNQRREERASAENALNITLQALKEAITNGNTRPDTKNAFIVLRTILSLENNFKLRDVCAAAPYIHAFNSKHPDAILGEATVEDSEPKTDDTKPTMNHTDLVGTRDALIKTYKAATTEYAGLTLDREAISRRDLFRRTGYAATGAVLGLTTFASFNKDRPSEPENSPSPIILGAVGAGAGGLLGRTFGEFISESEQANLLFKAIESTKPEAPSLFVVLTDFLNASQNIDAKQSAPSR